jgi:hypothetical protein
MKGRLANVSVAITNADWSAGGMGAWRRMIGHVPHDMAAIATSAYPPAAR